MTEQNRDGYKRKLGLIMNYFTNENSITLCYELKKNYAKVYKRKIKHLWTTLREFATHIDTYFFYLIPFIVVSL